MRGCALSLMLAAACAQGQGLPPASELEVTGDARPAPGRVRLTSAKEDQAGAVWRKSKQAIRGGFDTRFTFQFTEQGGLGKGADGLAFVVQNSAPGSIGGVGASGGFGSASGANHGPRPGIPYSLAVFFDTFHNREYRDPSDNAVHILINGTPDQRKWPPSQLAVVPKLRVKLKDRREHRARILYQPPLLAVFLDDALLAQTPADLSLVTDKDGRAWVGFTASTGGGYENHDLLSWEWSSSAESSISMVESSISFVLTACLPGKNLCTPEEAIVEEKEGGLYHVVLPAHLEWGASIPNESGREVEILNRHGLACWDVALAAAGCGGPDANLLSRNANGRTQFSVRDEGRNFGDNQGYFEFDVKLK